MMLRLILAGFATSMGLGLPSVRDVTCWAESGRAWAAARLDEATATAVRVAPAVDPVPASDPVGAIWAFRSALEETVAAFGDDRATVDDTSSGDGFCQVFGYEVVEPMAAGLGDGGERAAVAVAIPAAAGDLAVTGGILPPGGAKCEFFAYEVIEPSAADLVSGEGRVAASEADPASEPCLVASVEPPAPMAGDEAPTRAERLAAAVRLTRDAARAWAAMLGEPADEAGYGR